MKKEELKSLVEEITSLEKELSESVEIPLGEVEDSEESEELEELHETTQFDKYLKGVVVSETVKLNKKLVEGIEPNRRYNQLYREKSINRIKF